MCTHVAMRGWTGRFAVTELKHATYIGCRNPYLIGNFGYKRVNCWKREYVWGVLHSAGKKTHMATKKTPVGNGRHEESWCALEHSCTSYTRPGGAGPLLSVGVLVARLFGIRIGDGRKRKNEQERGTHKWQISELSGYRVVIFSLVFPSKKIYGLYTPFLASDLSQQHSCSNA